MSQSNVCRNEVIEELRLSKIPSNNSKDILIVVHDQIDYTESCIRSILETTENFNLLVWDNASSLATKIYLESLYRSGIIQHLIRSEVNVGFIKPNNALAQKSNSDYLIILNSDTVVLRGWDLLMVNYLKDHPDCGQVGYGGSLLNEDMMGCRPAQGSDPDYLCGWCFCIPKKVYQKVGLFDEENLKFAYGEDSDLSLRIQENGMGIYAFYSGLVYHHGNGTIKTVHNEMGNVLEESFQRNHEYLKSRWSCIMRRNGIDD